MTEKRQHSRVPVDFDVTCILGDGVAFHGSVADISFGGMFIECRRKLEFATPSKTSVSGVAPRELRLPAIVRWWRPHGFGVQFGAIGAYATHALMDFVKKRSS